MAYELLNAILASQNAVNPVDPFASFNNGQNQANAIAESKDRARAIGSRDTTNELLANGQYGDALKNAQAAGDIDGVKLTLGRQDSNRNLIGNISQRLLQMNPAQRQAALSSISPTLQNQGIDPSTIDLSDEGLNALAYAPVSSNDQIKYNILGNNSNAEMINANAALQRAQSYGQYNQGRLSIDQQNADTNQSRLGIQKQQADTNRYNATHKILSSGATELDNSDDFTNNGDGDDNGYNYDGTINPANSVYGHGQYGVPSKPLSSMNLQQVNAVQDSLRNNTSGKIGQGSNIGTSAIGIGGFTKPTLNQNMTELYGDDAPNIVMTPEVQMNVLDHQLDKNLSSNNKAQSLKNTFASLKNIPDAMLNDLDKNAIKQLVVSGENGVPLTSIRGSTTIDNNSRPANVSTPLPSSNGSVSNTNTPTPSIVGTIPQGAQVEGNTMNQPQTYRGRPILHSQDEQEQFANNGGGLAYYDNGDGKYSAINVKAQNQTQAQLEAADKLSRFNSARSQVGDLIKSGFDPRSYQNIISGVGNYGNDQIKQAQTYKQLMEQLKDIALHDKSGAAITQQELDEENNLMTIKPTDSPLNVITKMKYLDSLANGLSLRANGKFNRSDLIAKAGDTGVDEVNDIKQAIRDHDTSAIKKYGEKYSLPIISNLATDVKNEPITADDTKAILNAQSNKDRDVMASMIKKYGRDKIKTLLTQ